MTAREPRPYSVLGFGTTHDALSAEQLLKDLGVDVVPIPAPRSLSRSLCGIALRFTPRGLARAQELLERAGIKPVAAGEIEDV